MRPTVAIGRFLALGIVSAAAFFLVTLTAGTATSQISEPEPLSTPAKSSLEDNRQLYYERALTDEDLAGRTLRELSLMRNWIYARAGNPFRAPPVGVIPAVRRASIVRSKPTPPRSST